MENSFFRMIEGIAGLIVAVALVAVVVSKNAQTPQVIQASGSAFSNALGIAEAPVTGAQYTPNLSYPDESPFSSSPFMG